METPDRQLRCFVCIAQWKSLSRAAEELDRSQSWLSKQLAMLETSVGKPLFVRTGRGVELTEAGQKLFDAVQEPYRDIDRAFGDVSHVQGVTQGTVRLAVIHTLSYYFMADVIARFVGIHPRVNLSLLGRSSPEVVTLVESGKAELGFVYDSAVVSDSLVSQALFDDGMCLIVPMHSFMDAEDGLDLREQALRLVGFPEHYALRRMIHRSGIQAEYLAEAETVDAKLKLVSSGVGACILPERIPDELLADYHLKKIRIRQPLLRRRVVAVYRRDRPPLPLVEDLLQCANHVSRQLVNERNS